MIAPLRRCVLRRARVHELRAWNTCSVVMTYVPIQLYTSNFLPFGLLFVIVLFANSVLRTGIHDVLIPG